MHLPYSLSRKEKKNQNQTKTTIKNQPVINKRHQLDTLLGWQGKNLFHPSVETRMQEIKNTMQKIKQTVTEISHLDMLSDDLLRFWQSIMKNHLLCDLTTHFLCPVWQAHLLLKQFAWGKFYWVTETQSHGLQKPNRPTLLLHQTHGKMRLWENNNWSCDVKVFPCFAVLHT